MQSVSNHRLSVSIERLYRLCEGSDVSLGELLDELSISGHMLVCLFFSTPFLLPVPLPGLSTVFGFVIALASVQIMWGVAPWVPQSWRHRPVPTQILRKIFDLLLRLLRKIEHLVRPRMEFMSRHAWFIKLNAAAVFAVSALLALPMPPGFNAPPALAIILLSLGSLERDGYVVLLGYVVSAINLFLFGTFFWLGVDGVKMILTKVVG